VREAGSPKLPGEIHPYVSRGVVLQLLAVLRALSDINFVCGSPLARTLHFEERPCGYTFDDLSIVSPLTLQMVDFRGSAATVWTEDGEGVHVAPASVITDLFLANGAAFSRSQIFRLTSDSKSIFSYSRQAGLPVCGGSLDLYIFYVSMMTVPAFRSSLDQSPLASLLWRSLWTPDDLAAVEAKIVAASSEAGADYETVCAILRGFELRSDALEYLWATAVKNQKEGTAG
jgi:hypothetical protein